MATAMQRAPGFRTDEQNRQPPANIEAEQALLGALLLDNRQWERVVAILQPEHFADPVHGKIYSAISNLLTKGTQANPITLGAYCEAEGSLADRGGHSYLARLAASTITTMNSPDYARQIIDLWQRRMVIQAAQDAIDDAYDVSLDRSGAEITADTIDALSRMGQEGPFRFRTAREVRLNSLDAMKIDLPRTSTGYERLDKAMWGGLYAGKMYGIMARKKAGKTLMGGGIAMQAARWRDKNQLGGHIAYIAGEMGGDEIEQRQWAAEMRRNSTTFLSRRHNDDFWRQASDTASNATDTLLYLDIPGLTLDKLRRALAQFVMTWPDATGFVLDYIQLVRGRPKGMNGAEFMDEVADWLAAFCKERKVWGLVLAQENQEGNVRGGEGLRLACDMAFELARSDEGQGDSAWLTMIETRYTSWLDVGTAADPAFHLETKTGPYYREIPALVTEDEASKL